MACACAATGGLPASLADAGISASGDTLRAGRPLNLLMLDSSVVSLRNKLWERGYADAVVKVDTVLVSDESKTGDVAISIDPRWRTTGPGPS